METINDIADRYVDEYASLHPIDATYMGVPGHDDRLDDFSAGGFAAKAELARRTVAALTAASPTDEHEQVVKEAMLERLGLQLERYEAGETVSEVSVVTSGIHDIRMVFDLMPLAGEAAASNIAARLEAVPGALRDYRRP